MRQTYPTDLTDSQWELIQPIIEEKTHKKGRPAIHNKREIVNAIFYLIQSGCSWRLLPHDFPNWRTVYNHFRDWDNLGTWKQVNIALTKAYRKQKRKTPTSYSKDNEVIKPAGKGVSEQKLRTLITAIQKIL